MRIYYTITEDGQITLDFDGFQGVACLEEAEKILKGLKENFGVDVKLEKREMKPEAAVNVTKDGVLQ